MTWAMGKTARERRDGDGAHIYIGESSERGGSGMGDDSMSREQQREDGVRSGGGRHSCLQAGMAMVLHGGGEVTPWRLVCGCLG